MGSATMHEDMPTPPGCRPWQQVRADDLRRQWTASGRPLDVVSTIPSARDVPRSLLPQQALSTATPWASGSPVVHTRGLASPQGSCRQGPLGEVDLPIHRLQGDPGYLANAPTLRIEYESPCQGSSGGSECGLPSLSGDLMDVLQYCNSCTDSIEVENLYLRVPPDQLSQHPHVLAAILQKIVPLASLCMEVSPEDLVSLKSAFTYVVDGTSHLLFQHLEVMLKSHDQPMHRNLQAIHYHLLEGLQGSEGSHGRFSGTLKLFYTVGVLV